MMRESADSILEKLRLECKEPYIPIVSMEGLEIVLRAARIIGEGRALEIGTAIGYSSAVLARALPGLTIDTIDKDPKRMELAIELWEELNMTDRITPYLGDVREIIDDVIKDKTYDFVFMDGPKSAYLELLQKILPHIRKGGIIVSDNVSYMGMVDSDDYPPHKHRTIVTNMRKYVKFLKSDLFETEILYSTGDGIAVSEVL